MGAGTGIEGTVSAWASVFNLGNCAIGAGILSFPYAIQRSGLLGGVLICLIVAGIELFTLNVLMRQSTKNQAVTYQGLVKNVLGPLSSEIMAWTIFLFLFGSCVAFMIIVGDTFGAVLRQYVIAPLQLPSFLAARQLMILFPALTIMLPLSLQRSMGSLASASTVAVAVMMLTTAVIAARGLYAAHSGVAGDGTPFLRDVTLFRFDLSTFAAMPVMVFAYHCHVQAVPIYFELTDDPILFRRALNTPPDPDTITRKLKGMYNVLSAAYAECTIMYLATGVAGYLLFPSTASSNILNNFEPTDVLMQGVRFLVGWAVVLHYPINQHVARSAIYDLICRYSNVEPKAHVPYAHVAALTVGFFAATTTTACLVTDLGIVFQVIGGLAGSLLIFVLPGALLVRDAYKARARERTCGRGRPPHIWSAEDAGEDEAMLQSSSPIAVPGRSEDLAHLLPSVAAAGPQRAPVQGGGEWCEGMEQRWTSPWDVEAVGWALLVIGISVIVLTLYTTLTASSAPHEEGAHGDDAMTPRMLMLSLTLSA